MIDIKNISAGNFEFLDFPRKVSMEAYDKVMGDLSKRLSKSNSVRSVYTWGSISNPGISDLDIMVVLKKGKTLPLMHKSIYFMSRGSRHIVVHPFIVVDEAIARDVKFVYPDTNFKKISGSDVKFTKLNKAKELRASLLNDIIIRHLPRDFLTIISSERIDVRVALLRLKSLAYSLNLFHNATGKVIINSLKYEKEILELRDNWFSLDLQKQEESVVDLIRQALQISIEIVDEFNNYLKENSLARVDNKISEIIYSGEKNKTLFIRDWNKKDALDYSGKLVKLPINLAAQLICYGAQKGHISIYIQNNLNPKNIDYKLKNENIAKKRISILNSQAEIASHLHFPAFFDFGFIPEKGINKLANIACKIRNLAR